MSVCVCMCVCVCAHADPSAKQTLKPGSMKMTGLRNQKASRQMVGQWNGSNQKPTLMVGGGWWWCRVWTENATRVHWGEALQKQTSTARTATSVHHYTVSDKYLSRGKGDYAHVSSLTHRQRPYQLLVQQLVVSGRCQYMVGRGWGGGGGIF